MGESKTDKHAMMNGANGKLPTLKQKPPVDTRQGNPKETEADEDLWIDEWKILASTCIFTGVLNLPLLISFEYSFR